MCHVGNVSHKRMWHASGCVRGKDVSCDRVYRRMLTCDTLFLYPTCSYGT